MGPALIHPFSIYTKTTAQSATACSASLSEPVHVNDRGKGIAMEALQSGHILQSIVIK